ncbi:hypothetical protein C1701_10940 [Actinoalloteichus sp. AHMU CJ021]|nr:hypothetical protein C1701_10940 [Actinoalloteichus sp. AHMU CJ021]
MLRLGRHRRRHDRFGSIRTKGTAHPAGTCPTSPRRCWSPRAARRPRPVGPRQPGRRTGISRYR